MTSKPNEKKNKIVMEAKNKVSYETPAMRVLEVKAEGIICQSGDRSGYPGYEI